MFDFFKDVIDEANGIDVEQRDRLRKAQKMDEKAERVFLPKGAKSMMYFFGVLYILLTILIVVVNISSHVGLSGCIKQILLSILNIASLILISVKKKQTEICGVACFALFVILLIAI